ncbi:MAG TPA: hypothetical protein DDW52_18750 [Planctomycetaceae bacterium]|nr:hypothetical protein [Planctomycetaceae bacterium]
MSTALLIYWQRHEEAAIDIHDLPAVYGADADDLLFADRQCNGWQVLTAIFRLNLILNKYNEQRINDESNGAKQLRTGQRI